MYTKIDKIIKADLDDKSKAFDLQTSQGMMPEGFNYGDEVYLAEPRIEVVDEKTRECTGKLQKFKLVRIK